MATKNKKSSKKSSGGRAQSNSVSSKKSSTTTSIQSGRYTPKTPKSYGKSPRWYAPICLAIIVLALLTIIINYTASILPGSPSNWYLIGGVIGMAAGLMALMNYK